MNIFFLALNPRLCAQYHCDRHVVKMILETAQLLCTTHHSMRSLLPPEEVQKLEPIPYRSTHKNHPSAKWLREDVSHYTWLTRLGCELVKEYQFRYGSKKQHKTQPVIEWCAKNIPPGMPSHLGFRSPPKAMPEDVKVEESDSIAASLRSYRNYYVVYKRHFAYWKNRDTPQWFLDLCKEQNLQYPVVDKSTVKIAYPKSKKSTTRKRTRSMAKDELETVEKRRVKRKRKSETF